MNTTPISKYALLSRTTKLRLHYSKEVPREIVGSRGTTETDDEITTQAGHLIKLFQTTSNPGSRSNSIVQVLDMVTQQHFYENLFECPKSNLLCVDEGLWPFVISIDNLEMRLKLAQDTEHCKWFLYLKPNDLVCVSGKMFENGNDRYDCIIRYIGPVPELHPVGYLFGLELLNLDSGISPQAEQIPFSHRYTQTSPSLTIFTTANWLFHISKEVNKKNSTKDIISGFGDRLLAAGSAVLGGASNANTSSRQKKGKTFSHSAGNRSQFYADLATDTTDSVSKEMDIKKDIPTDNEELNRTKENNDRSVEQLVLTSTAQTQTSAPYGILKNKHEGNVKLPSSSGRRLGFHDTVTIDQYEIEEMPRYESSVIVEKEGVDLHELLRGDWPKTAGDAGEILNQPKTQNSTQMRPSMMSSTSASASSNVGSGVSVNTSNKSKNSNRNKSSNPLSHVGARNTKYNKNTIQKGQKKYSKRGSNAPQAFYENYDNTDDNKHLQTLKANESNDALINTDGYDLPELLPAVLDGDFADVSQLPEIPGTGLVVGSMVEVNVPECSGHLFGVIRWIGIPPNENVVMAGVELEEDYIDKQLSTTNGGFNGVSLFKCPPGRGLFVTSEHCCSDRRFSSSDGAVGNDVSTINNNYKVKQMNGSFHDDQQSFGHMDCPVVPGAITPIKCLSLNELEELCGKFKGIQGHHNSCYLDVTLFSMFTFTPVFDAVLYRPPDKEDIPNYTEVQNVLREEIVNPLRKHMFVRADRVMKLRQLLDKLSSVSGLTSEEKDPEEFLNCILAQILRAEPFLKLNSGQDAYYYQLFVEKDERLSFPSVQQLFEQSFYTSDIKLKEVPSCLIIQMPRFGKNYKMYPRILPSQVLDVTDIIEDSPRQCSVCGMLAEFECRDCFGIMQSGFSLESTSFCATCIEIIHKHVKRSNHKHRKLLVPQDFRVMADHMRAPRLYMELFAVVCIETSHYVTFVKAGSGPDAPWCFFDSMADRKGELNGYNIPEMITVPDLPQWLSDEGARTVNETSSNDKMLPEHAKRLFCDAYMCMYQSTEVMMYR